MFVAVLVALGLAYFFGLMTGLAGKPTESSGREPLAATPASTVAGKVEKKETPSAIETSGTRADRAPSAEPTAPASLPLFEDRGEPEPTPPRARPTPETAATSRTARAPARGEFWVQVLSVASEREARARSAKLRAHRFRAAVVPGATARGTVYRVRVGPYPTREDAARAAAKLKSEEKVNPWIVPAGS